MKKIIFILFCAIATVAKGQFFTIAESSANPSITLDTNKIGIVDINGRLTIKMNPQQLTLRLAQSTNVDPIRAEKLQALILILQNQQQIMKKLHPYVSNVPVNMQKLSDLSKLMVDFLNKIRRNQPINNLVNSYYDDAFNIGYDTIMYTTPDAYVIYRLSLYTDTLTSLLQKAQGMDNIKIQLQAFLNTQKESNRRVHIENFDTYSEGVYYEVPRWVTTFSESDISTFNQVTALSTDLNNLVAGNFAALLKQIPDSLNAYTCFASLIKDFQNRIATEAESGSQEVKKFLSTINQQLTSIYISMQQLQEQKNNTNANVLQQFNSITSSFLSLAQSLPNSVDSFFNQLTSEAKNQLQALKTEFNQCVIVLNNDIAAIKNIYNTTSGLLAPFKHTAGATQQATDDALSLTLNQLPSQGFINLKTTGNRENGDEIVIKLKCLSPEGTSSGNWQTLQQQVIELQQINFYSETSVGVIVASPIGSSNDVKLASKFQFAPSGSLLLKFGSRKCRLWNTISPGIGFNISTPDFNLDGSPDVAYGGVMTLFKNVLSFGLSYNTKTSSSFWFFGLSLPFSTIGLPIGGHVQTQKNN